MVDTNKCLLSRGGHSLWPSPRLSPLLPAAVRLTTCRLFLCPSPGLQPLLHLPALSLSPGFAPTCSFCCFPPSRSLLLLPFYFQQLLLPSRIFPDASLPLSSPVGATQGSSSPLLAQGSGVGLYIITSQWSLMIVKHFHLSPHNSRFTATKTSRLQLNSHPTRPLTGVSYRKCIFTAL